MGSFRFVVADVFTDVPFAGNQLAVFTDARDLDGPTMQALAAGIELERLEVRRPSLEDVYLSLVEDAE